MATSYCSTSSGLISQSRSAEISPRGRPKICQSAPDGSLQSRTILHCKPQIFRANLPLRVIIIAAEYYRRGDASRIPHNAYSIFYVPSSGGHEVRARNAKNLRFPTREATSPKMEIQGIISSIYKAFLPFPLFLPSLHCRPCLYIAAFLHDLLTCCVALSCLARRCHRVIALFFICLAI